MTDSDILNQLKTRLDETHARVTKACERVGRSPADITLVAVTKSVGPRVARLVSTLGIRDFGENRPQELWRKAKEIPGIQWHFIGHMQRNKLDQSLPFIHLFHSIDSMRLLTTMGQTGRSIQGFLEVNCSGEVQKGGFAPDEVPTIIESLPHFPHVNIMGFMTMAAYSENPEDARPAFQRLRHIAEQARVHTNRELPYLSMGMSGDFEIAIEEGATHIRLGTTLFHGLEGEG
jgi:hypothetical protein